MKVDKTLVASVLLHVLVIGWGLVSFSSKAFESTPEESLPVDIISADQLVSVTAGMKSGKKENPKPLVEKVAEAKPVDEAVGKVVDKKPPVVTETAPPPQPKSEEKPVEKKPEPPKPVAEAKPKEEPKPVEKKPEPPKVDPIAEALKKEEKKPLPKPQVQAAKPPEQSKPKERSFDQTKIAALLDKRDPTRQAVIGDTLNSNAALGLATGRSTSNSTSWQSAFMQRVRQCFNFPYNGVDIDAYFADIDIPMSPDGKLAGTPVIRGTSGPQSEVAKAMADNAVSAIVQCAPYTTLPREQYASWKLIESRFGLKQFQ